MMFSSTEKDRIVELEPRIEITGTVILKHSSDCLEWLASEAEQVKFLKRFRAKSIVRVEKGRNYEYFDYNHNAANKPKASDIMYCLLSDAMAATEPLFEFFADFCGGEDSIENLSCYIQCNDTLKKLAKIFGRYNPSLLYRYVQAIDSRECEPLWEMHKTQQAK